MLTEKQREEKRMQKRQALSLKQKSSKWVGTLNAIAGVLSIVFAWYLLLETKNIIIDSKWLWLSAVIFCLPILLFCDKKYYYTMYYWFLAAGLFLYANCVFADRTAYTIKRPIEHKFYSYKKSGPHAEISYRRVNLEVPCDSDRILANSHYAVLTLSSGLFGFEIVRDRKLIRE
ncbi:hypothetical protein [Mucilaginibacter psychrotolerans]|uniref:Uncharacterized protein n=1 Tax=Mucilaginibacter psychrotolerans TaxID=1524096 RepID=A0A4Y8SAM4_9SPHI|nr:hypothetical protein [Mucilaginibacter psychrotolerans]TFF35617.1 hypothetical protein E2R66_18070 [Mucilaginibacter psychrotolerans]